MTAAAIAEPRREAAPSAPWREHAVLFGAGLVGVHTVPSVPNGARAIVVANVGTHHHVGPFRVWVDVARVLAADGWHVLRLDQAGLGDSAPRGDASDVFDDGARDLRAAMTWLATHHGIEQFAVIGFCSGVDGAHAVAVSDPRVVAAAFIDGHTYTTLGHQLRRLLRFGQRERWARWLRRRTRRFAGDAATLTRASLARDDAAVFDRRPPSRGAFRADVRRLTERGARLLFVYTGTLDSQFNDPRQLRELLGPSISRDLVDAERYASADHVFSAVGHRAMLIERLRRWAAAVR